MDKYYELIKYSNPEIVFNKAEQLGYNIKISTRKNKKYMVEVNPNVWIHFGQFPYEDATKHNDQIRINNFKKRNWRWALRDKYSPAYLSYTLLW